MFCYFTNKTDRSLRRVKTITKTLKLKFKKLEPIIKNKKSSAHKLSRGYFFILTFKKYVCKNFLEVSFKKLYKKFT